jgi:hypothetical protein
MLKIWKTKTGGFRADGNIDQSMDLGVMGEKIGYFVLPD